MRILLISGSTRRGSGNTAALRTVQALDYDGFGDFSDDLRLHFMARITPYTVLKAAAKEKPKKTTTKKKSGK